MAARAAGPHRPDGPLPFDWDATALSNQFTDPQVRSWRDSLRQVLAPALLIAGGPASHIDQSQLADMATLIPDCELVTIPAGHLVHAARPAEFTALVTRFLVAWSLRARMLRAPAIPVHDFLDRPAPWLRPPALRGISHRDQRHGQRVGRQAEQFTQLLLVPAVERGQRGADAIGTRGEAELLHRAVDGRTDPRACRIGRAPQHREDPDRGFLDVVRQVLRP